MDFERLQRFLPLYTSPRYTGAAALLNRAFDFPKDQVVPLSISHGVDFNMCQSAMDVYGNEPLHWAYNDGIYRRAARVKPVVRMPHPWWFVARDQLVPTGERMLVVGPPPGRTNDERLLKVLRESHDISELDILLKRRGDSAGSEEFWRRNGCRVVTAGEPDDGFYDRLFSLIASYSTVICCTFSSAAIFAASIGKTVRFLNDYKYLAYEVPNYLEVMDFHSGEARQVVMTFLRGGREEVSELACALLGFTDTSLAEIKNRYVDAVHAIKSPTIQSSLFSLMLRELALVLGRPGLASLDVRGVYKKTVMKREVAAMEIAELSVWQDGVTAENFRLKKVRYVPGVTRPGAALERFPDHDCNDILRAQ